MPEELEKEINPTVLVVDDDTEIVDLLIAHLTAENYHTIVAYDGESAVKKAKKHKPDLILLDVDLPKKKGYEVCEILKSDKSTKYIPIIILTAITDSKIMKMCYGAGADEFVNKPFEPTELIARVKAMLRLKLLQDGLTEINTKLESKIEEKTKQLHSLYIQTIKSLVTAIDAKDHYTRRHSSRVAEFATAIAKQMDLSESEVMYIQEAAELHDLGKIAIPDSILKKEGKLTKEEWEEVKKHPVKSTEILEPLFFLDGTIDIIKQHHEKCNGGGYPFGNRKEDIPLGARIIAVADSYEAMTSDRPYRKAFSKNEAIAELKKCSGTQFDSEIVEAFLFILEKPDYQA